MGQLHINFNAMPDDEQMVIAMEVWEAVLNLHMGKGAINEQVTAAFYANGTARMREIATVWCEPCWKAWATREAEQFDDCFDWAWIPLFLAECIDWSHPRRPSLKPDHDDIASKFTDWSRAPAPEAAQEASA